MKKLRDRKILGLSMQTALALLAVFMILGASVGRAWSYFTTFALARGSYTIAMNEHTEIEEEFSNWTKHLVISNKDDSEPVMIRARGYCGDEYRLTYSGTDWTEGTDGFWYYAKVVDPGYETEELLVKITDKDGNEIPKEQDKPAEFNVVVVYESTTVITYDADGNPKADWDQKVTVINKES